MQEAQDKKPQEGERRCQQCHKIRPLLAFSLDKSNTDKRRDICSVCEYLKRQARYRRLDLHGNPQQQAAQQVRKQQESEQKTAYLRAYEQQQQEKEQWYLQQPDRRCRACKQVLPASAFGGIISAHGFTLHTRCTTCHAALRERHQLACCLCQQKKPRRDFISHYDGYALRDNGAWISLCCHECEPSFLRLSTSQQWGYIHTSCQKSFPSGQVVYAELDPEIGHIRYVGRTNNPRRRHIQHLADVSPTAAQWGPERKEWYTRRNWIHELSEKGLTPSMQILERIKVSPLIVEWEQRYIWHGIQKGWMLLNVEAMNTELVDRAKATQIDFLQVPFDVLVQQGFFSSQGLVALLHRLYQSS